MDLETMKKIIKQNSRVFNKMIRSSEVAERYYRKENDILKGFKQYSECGSPLRNADNRIPSNFHNILVNQKAAYIFTVPPVFDVGGDRQNKKIADILGDKYAKVCKDLCINASNSSVAWLHCWIDEENNFKYAVVDSKQIFPIWGDDLEKKLLAVMRVYSTIEDGEAYSIYEYWNDERCYSFRKKKRQSILQLQEYERFYIPSLDETAYDSSNEFEHEFSEVPFIPFFNNNIGGNDLNSIKHLIDCYDKIYSGFINDLEDIQEIIFVLSGYGGQDLKGFLESIKKYKVIKTDKDEDGDGKGDLETLSIDIPVEARKIGMEITRKSIFEQGQGIDPDPQNFGNSSGVALDHLYDLIELKSGLLEAEFREGFGKLIRFICNYLKFDVKSINQSWTRTSVHNDADTVNNCKNSVGIVSNRTILKKHPLVDDVDREMEQIREEEQERIDAYSTKEIPIEKEV